MKTPEIIFSFGPTERCVGMINYRDRVIIATDCHIYEYQNDQFQMLEIVSGETDAKEKLIGYEITDPPRITLFVPPRHAMSQLMENPEKCGCKTGANDDIDYDLDRVNRQRRCLNCGDVSDMS